MATTTPQEGGAVCAAGPPQPHAHAAAAAWAPLPPPAPAGDNWVRCLRARSAQRGAAANEMSGGGARAAQRGKFNPHSLICARARAQAAAAAVALNAFAAATLFGHAAAAAAAPVQAALPAAAAHVAPRARGGGRGRRVASCRIPGCAVPLPPRGAAAAGAHTARYGLCEEHQRADLARAFALAFARGARASVTRVLRVVCADTHHRL
jgi:hypothetical protein